MTEQDKAYLLALEEALRRTSESLIFIAEMVCNAQEAVASILYENGGDSAERPDYGAKTN